VVAASLQQAEPRFLPEEEFLQVVANAPLVSIDLLASDPAGRVLLGLRRNAPARDSWFVPGGIVRKNEHLDAAYARIAHNELGLVLQRADARFQGVYQHFYGDNFGGRPGFGTHYVVLAYALKVDEGLRPPKEQHRAYRWLTPAELLADAAVHAHSKDYFR
jgi:colanic acid biosynthesis protein WcaH